MKLAADRKGEVTYLKNRMEHYQRLQTFVPEPLASPPDQPDIRETESSSTCRKKPAGKQPAKSLQPPDPQGRVGKNHRSFLRRPGHARTSNSTVNCAFPRTSRTWTISLSEIKGITIDEMPWKELIGDAKTKLDLLANALPHDQHALFFPTFKSMVEVMDEATAQGTPLLRLGEGQGRERPFA